MPPLLLDRSILFAALARHLDLVSLDVLVSALRKWQENRSQPVREVLREQDTLTVEVCDLLDGLVGEHLRRHGDDLARSLAAIAVFAELRSHLEGLLTPEIQATLNTLSRPIPPMPPSGGPPLPAKAGEPAGATLATANGIPSPTGATLATANGIPSPTDATRSWPSDPPSAPAGSAARAAAPARFRTLRLLGRGGLGEVFIAQDEELQREVALKEIQARHLHSDENRDRFVLEAEITGRLEHPGIVPVYGLGTHADGRPFYAMRFIKGESLQQALTRFHGATDRPERERILELRQLLSRFVALCNAIAYAHSRGVLHRDIKPANVMLGEFGETLVVDWGLAKRLEAREISRGGDGTALASNNDSSFTQMGQVIGTPAFMSPEQAAGRLDALGPASDVYSLGATLYALVTGQPPFTERQLDAVLQAVQDGQFPRPRAVRPFVPPALEAIVLKAMALRPEDRYASAKDLAGDVDRWLADEPTTAYHEPWTQQLGRWARRHQTRVAAAIVLVLTATIGLGIGALILNQEQARTVVALKKETEALGKAAEARQREEEARGERVLAQVKQLGNADAGAVPEILNGLEPYRADILPRLRERWARPDGSPKERQERMRIGLALLASEPEAVTDVLLAWMLETDDPREMELTRDALAPHSDTLKECLWATVEDKATKPPVRFRALVGLARFDPDNPRWREAAPTTLEAWLRADPLFFGVLTRALQPARKHLIGPLVEVAKGLNGPLQDKRYEAASVLAIYAAEQTETLVDLLAEADERQFALFFPRVQARGEEALALLHRERERQPAPPWPDAPLATQWGKPDEAVRREIEQADGLVAERFALCQTLALDRFVPLAEGLRRVGYRPVHCRPFNSQKGFRVAVVWTRDARTWEMVIGKDRGEIRTLDEQYRARGWAMVDVYGYLNERAVVYGALWAPAANSNWPDYRLFLGLSGPQLDKQWEAVRDQGYVPATYQKFLCQDSTLHNVQIWQQLEPKPGEWQFRNYLEEEYEQYLARTSLSLLPIEVGLVRDPDLEQQSLAEATSWFSTGGSQGLAGLPWCAVALRTQRRIEKVLRGRYTVVSHSVPGYQGAETHGLDPAAHLARCRQLAAEGYRPVAVSVAELEAGQPLATASVWHRPVVAVPNRDALASRQANVALALLRLKQEEVVWPLLAHRPDPTLRTYLVLRMATRGVSGETLIDRLASGPEVSERRALLSALGEYDEGQLPANVRARVVPRLLTWYREDPDPGLHGSIDWLLRPRMDGPRPRVLDWGQAKALDGIDAERRGKPADGRRWSINAQGQTMVHFPGPVEFWMGSPPSERNHQDDELLHRRRIERSFAIASKKVTVRDFEAFRKAYPEQKQYGADPDCPVLSLNWYDAAMYCRWLSEQEGIPEEEMCYPSIEEITKCKDGQTALKLPANHLLRKGYRLPTEAEWEYACRAGTTTAHSYGGGGEELIAVHAWYLKNAEDRTWPVGQKRPNDFGLFDMHGNTWDWCDVISYGYQTNQNGNILDEDDNKDITDRNRRVLRGGSFNIPASGVRSAYRYGDAPSDRGSVLGLRVARTL